MPAPPADPTTSRRLVVAGGAGLVVVALGAVARRTAVSQAELDVFRWFNEWPDAVARPLWLVMQLGSFWGGLVLAVAAMAVLRGPRGALAAAVATVTAWSLAVITKAWVSRGRPPDYLAGVRSRFEHLPTGNGYPSGHTAVAFAVATLVAGALPGRWRVVPFVLAALVAVGRLYFGAHLPLDVVGGAALGVGVGTLSRFLLSPPVSSAERSERV